MDIKKSFIHSVGDGMTDGRAMLPKNKKKKKMNTTQPLIQVDTIYKKGDDEAYLDSGWAFN